jgi:hypothetical protein
MAFARHPPSRTEPGQVSARLLPTLTDQEFRRVRYCAPILQAWVADEMSTDTPGPMVEDSDTFFR